MRSQQRVEYGMLSIVSWWMGTAIGGVWETSIIVVDLADQMRTGRMRKEKMRIMTGYGEGSDVLVTRELKMSARMS